MEGHLSDKIKDERATVIKKISAEKYQEFVNSNLGQEAEVLVEKHLDRSGKFKGVTRNYLTVLLDEGEFNTLKRVRLTKEMIKK